MASTRVNIPENKREQSRNSQPQQIDIETAQQWSRSIPISDYITLGTIRYGVRLSTISTQSHSICSETPSTNINTPSNSTNSFSIFNERSENRNRLCSRSNSSCCCCCISSNCLKHSSNSNNYETTKFSKSARKAKNRTVPTTSQSLSFSLGGGGGTMSASEEDHPPPAVADVLSRSPQILSTTIKKDRNDDGDDHHNDYPHRDPYVHRKISRVLSAPQSKINEVNIDKSTYSNLQKTQIIPKSLSLTTVAPITSTSSNTTLSNTASVSKSSFNTEKPIHLKVFSVKPTNFKKMESGISTTILMPSPSPPPPPPPPIQPPRITSTIASPRISSGSAIVANVRSTRSASETEPYESCESISCSKISCCKLNSASVLIEQCREHSASPSTDPIPSICCYTIVNNTNNNNNNNKNNSKILSKQTNRNNSTKRILSSSSLSSKKSECSSLTGIGSTTTTSPPPVPPKPPPPPPPPPPLSLPLPPPNSNSNVDDNSNNNEEDHSYDPIHFRRKIEKFEQQSAIDYNDYGSNRFELLNCFSRSQANNNNNNTSPTVENRCTGSSSSISEFSSIAPSNNKNNFAILKSSDKINSPLEYHSNNNTNNLYDNSNNIHSICHLRYDSFGKAITNRSPNSNNNSKLKYFTESSPSSSVSVVIRKLTPKLSKKSFPFVSDRESNRGESEDRLINRNEIDYSLPSSSTVSSRVNSNIEDDENDDIGFINTSGNDGNDHQRNHQQNQDNRQQDQQQLHQQQHQQHHQQSHQQKQKQQQQQQISSFSDLDIHHLTCKVVTSINKNSCNLSLDSVPNIINNNRNESYNNNNNNNNNTQQQSLSTRDLLYNSSLSDIDSSTLSFLSEDDYSFYCICNNSGSDQNFKSDDLNDLILSASNKSICICNEESNLRNLRNNSNSSELINNPNISKDQNKKRINNSNNNKEFKISLCDSDNTINNNNNSPPSPSPSLPSSSSSSSSLLPQQPLPPLRIRSTSISSSTPTTSATQVSNLLSSSGGPVLKRVPTISSFGYIHKRHQQLYVRGQHQQHQHQHQQQQHQQYEKTLAMEKRRNTLDRLQRLGFGRKSSPGPTQENNTSKSNRKSNEKSERLKELTELLRGNRSSPTPPPVPPPRKLRHSNSLEKPNESTGAETTSAESVAGPFSASESDDIKPMDEEEEHIPASVKRKSDNLSSQSKSNSNSNSPKNNNTNNNTQKLSLYQSLRPNKSVSNLETLIFKRGDRDKAKTPPPIISKDDELFTKLSRVESKSIVGSYAQKAIPFRSASFSQIDYSSGKYIKSAFGAIRDRLRRDKPEPSVVENANLTLPRKKDNSRSQSPSSRKHRRSGSADREITYIPLKKTELNINLKYESENERISLEEIVNPPDVILEEEGSTILEGGKLSESQQNLTTATETVPDDSINLTRKESIESIVPSSVEEKSKEASLELLKISNVAEFVEEEIPMESPPETFLQTATTCLIPVPVYECAAQEWCCDNATEQWVDVAQDEIGMSPELFVPLEDNLSTTKIEDEENTSEATCNILPLAIDPVPTISVSQDQSSSEDQKTDDSNSNNEKSGTSDDQNNTPPTDKNSESEKPFKYTEVKKRYSNDDIKPGDNSISANSSLNRGGEDKKRLDKSRRRKGMYIQWPSIDKSDTDDWGGVDELKDKEGGLDLTKVDFSSIKSPLSENNTPLFLNCRTPESSRNSGAQLFDPCTPENEYNRPIWPKVNSRRKSLSYQSSEEKDDGTLSSSFRKLHKKNIIRSDSTSDNESDRAPSSREQTSPSPVPGDHDLKRYSKRPPRGPYGQMLEAEMKKPTKLNFDEILEELKTPERSPGLHGSGSQLSDESRSGQKTDRNRKSNTSLPVPIHTRAASTPSQMENTTTTASIAINPLEKRYRSNIDNSSLETPPVTKSKDPKEFSFERNRDRSPKRASSDTVSPLSSEVKQLHPKRSASTAGEKHPKRSLDEMRLSQSNRSPSSGRNVFSEHDKSNTLPTPELLAELLKGSSERMVAEQRQQMFSDTRTHIVQEIFRNEQSYVDSLQTVVQKYLNVLKTPDYAGMIDSKTVDDIFFMVPEILKIHEKFLNELKARLDTWDAQQKVGDSFIETFSKSEVLDTYTSFVNNCNKAKDAIRLTCQTRPSFSRFLEAMSREHKGKLTLDNLLIKPVQKFPNYEMLFTRLIKHTDIDHPDQKHLQEVLKLVHDILVHINCKEKEVLENGQREATLRELEGVIEGMTELVVPERQFIIFDLVSMPSGQGARKERGFFLFSDLLVITSIKRRSGTIRKPNTSICPGSVASTLDTNKYKFLTKVSLENLEIVKTKDENLRRIMNEVEQLADDCSKLQQIAEVAGSLKCPHQNLEDTIRDLHREVQRQLSERQSNDTQLNLLELTVNSPNGSQKLSVLFSKTEKRSQWEEAFNEAKQKLAASSERHPTPEFLMSIPIRKTRAGLQFTCAAPTLSSQKDVWVCNSDGYVGQVCVLSLSPEPTVTSCNGVCNARILCVSSVPAYSETKRRKTKSSKEETSSSPRNSSNLSSQCQISLPNTNNEKRKSKGGDSGSDIQLDSNSSSEESENEMKTNSERMPSPAPSLIDHQKQQDSISDETDSHQSTMWLGTEDGCIHVYNCTDNIRIKKNKIKIQHVSAVYSILYLDNRVFVALANGDICVYLRNSAGWNTTSPLSISIGTVSSPVSKILNVHGKLWCAIQGIIKVLDSQILQVENQIQISSDSKPVTNMAVSNNFVWISIQNSAHIKCFHSNSYDLILEVNLAPSVNKMLSNCDDIIRQHKAACLRVTSLLACRDLIWIGTSAGVLLTIPAQGYNKGQSSTNTTPIVTGIPHGHTGHVRFLTCVETELCSNSNSTDDGNSDLKNNRHSIHSKTKSELGNVLIISGGDGYEDFRSSGANPMSEIAGREDSTNHLLLWQI